MTSTEDLVRAGLHDLAPAAPADDAAYAGVRRAITRRRRQRAAARVTAVAALALVAVGTAALVQREDTPGYSTDRGGTTETTAPGTSASAPSRSVTFGPATFDVPADWVVVSNNGNDMCVAPDGTEDMSTCAGLRLSRGELVGYEGGAYIEHGDWSWYTATDVMRCPDGPGGPGEELDDVRAPGNDRAPIEQGRRPVGDRTAVYDKWAAECTLTDFRFTPRAWLVRELQLLIVDELDNPETEQILASFEFADGASDAVDTTDTSTPADGAGGAG
ncbi:MAG TPA: hypothetical protein VF015_14265 [Acidimicrobiales bacterium]